jgi:hypothetical protein
MKNLLTFTFCLLQFSLLAQSPRIGVVDHNKTILSTSGTYAQIDQNVWLEPTLQAAQDRLDLHKIPIDLANNTYFKKGIEFISKNDLTYELYYPADSTTFDRPLIIWAHGGAFIKGQKKDRAIEYLCNEFAKRGFINASIEYRLKSLGGYSMTETAYLAVQDGNAAIRYFRKNADKYSIDTGRIFIAGISAGGILALNAGHFDEGDDLMGLSGQLDNKLGCANCSGYFTEVDNSVAGVINIVGATPAPNILDNDIPTLHIYCPDDQVIPAYKGRPLKKVAIPLVGKYINREINNLVANMDIPDVYGPLYLKENYPLLTNHTFVSAETMSNNCSHNLIYSTSGKALRGSADNVVEEVNSFLVDVLSPKFDYQPVTKLDHQWATITLPPGVTSFDVTAPSRVKIKKERNSFQIKSNEIGSNVISISATNNLGLTTNDSFSFRAKYNADRAIKVKKRNKNLMIIGGGILCLLLLVLLIRFLTKII